MIHHGQASTLLANRQATPNVAYAAHPELFPPGKFPSEVWINPPQTENLQTEPSGVLVRTITRLNH